MAPVPAGNPQRMRGLSHMYRIRRGTGNIDHLTPVVLQGSPISFGPTAPAGVTSA